MTRPIPPPRSIPPARAVVCERCGHGSVLGYSHVPCPTCGGGRWVAAAATIARLARPQRQRV